MSLSKSYEDENIHSLSVHAYVGIYRDINIVSKGVTEENGLSCNLLAMRGNEVIRCPYMVKLGDRYIPADAYQINVGGRWYLMPKADR